MQIPLSRGFVGRGAAFCAQLGDNFGDQFGDWFEVRADGSRRLKSKGRRIQPASASKPKLRVMSPLGKLDTTNPGSRVLGPRPQGL